jgi:hypothetical protein
MSSGIWRSAFCVGEKLRPVRCEFPYRIFAMRRFTGGDGGTFLQGFRFGSAIVQVFGECLTRGQESERRPVSRKCFLRHSGSRKAAVRNPDTHAGISGFRARAIARPGMTNGQACVFVLAIAVQRRGFVSSQRLKK